ncbi:VWA domain-containing protein [Streptomyces sp. NPDC058751]|uniref:VWA domain-containing protein n=1 Tax=Streptomyces sp. NPDC058751 TaxID=3346623 RepID=UPI0036A06731
MSEIAAGRVREAYRSSSAIKGAEVRTMSLRKGENAALTVRPVALSVSVGGLSADVSALLLGVDGKVRSDDDLVFYNHPFQDGVSIDGRTVSADLALVPRSVDRVVIAERRAAVYLILDHGRYMEQLYESFAVQSFAERVLALSANLDDDGTVPVIFSSRDEPFLEEIGLDNYRGRIGHLHQRRLLRRRQEPGLGTGRTVLHRSHRRLRHVDPFPGIDGSGRGAQSTGRGGVRGAASVDHGPGTHGPRGGATAAAVRGGWV